MIRPPDPNDKRSSDPVREILHRIRALPPADIDRLVRQLELWPPEQLAGCAIVSKRLLDTLAHAVRVGLRGCVDAATRGRQFKRTHQRKRGPSEKTLVLLTKIRRQRAKRKPWRVIDRMLGLTPGCARKLFYDAKKREERG